MAYTKSSLSRLNKDDFIRIALDMQSSKLRKSYKKLEADSSVFKSVTETMRRQIVILERKSWSNEQCLRPECLEISGLSSSTENSQLDGIVW